MWYHAMNGAEQQPIALDKNSSKKYVYVRKNFILIPAQDDNAAHWEWDEIKIKKEDWVIYESVMAHDSALDDVYAALTELAAIVAGE